MSRWEVVIAEEDRRGPTFGLKNEICYDEVAFLDCIDEHSSIS